MADRFSLDGVQVGNSTPLTEAPPVFPEYEIADDPQQTFPGESKAAGPSPQSVSCSVEPAKPLSLPKTAAARKSALGSRKAWLSIAAGLAVVALVEGLVIATMFVRERLSSSEAIITAGSPASEAAGVQAQATQAPAPLVLAAGLAPAGDVTVSDQSGSTIPDTPLDAEGQNADTLAAAIAQAARNQRSGGVRLAAPIELKVLQGDRVLGSSADGPIVTTAGTHELDLINASFGFRTRRAVTFRAGEITTVAIAVPPGRISVNAEPWAEVWIDNRPMGETPLANLEIPVGEHEVLFRHPELGERRQNVIVRADTVTRASTTFDR